MTEQERAYQVVQRVNRKGRNLRLERLGSAYVVVATVCFVLGMIVSGVLDHLRRQGMDIRMYWVVSLLLLPWTLIIAGIAVVTLYSFGEHFGDWLEHHRFERTHGFWVLLVAAYLIEVIATVFGSKLHYVIGPATCLVPAIGLLRGNWWNHQTKLASEYLASIESDSRD